MIPLTLLFGLLLPIVLLFGTPGITAPLPAAGLALGGALAILSGFAWDKTERYTLGPVWACALLLTFGLAAAGSLSSYQSKVQLSILCAAVGTLTALSLSTQSRRRWHQACLVLVLAASAASLLGWWKLFGAEAPVRLMANWTNPDCFAVIPLCGIFLAGALQAHTTGFRRTALLLAGVFLAATIVLTFSRSAWAGLVLGVIVVALRARSLNSSSLKESLYYSLCAFLPLLLFLSYAGLWGSVGSRWSKTWSSPYDIPLRQEVWTGSLKAFSQRPFTGSGPGTFPLAYQQYRPQDTPSKEFMNAAHNDTLQVMVETGLIGLLCWLGLLLQAGRSALDCRRTGWATQSSWLLGGMAALFTYSLFNFALPVPACIVWWFALLGLAFSLPGEKRDWRDKRQSLGLAVAAVLVLSGSLTVMQAYRLQQARQASSSADTALQRLDWNQAFSHFTRAVTCEPDNIHHRLRRASLSRDLFTLTSDLTWKEQAEEDLKEARDASPRDLPALTANYRFYLAQGQFAQARDAAAHARHFAPYEKKFSRYLAGLDALEGDLAGAVTILLREDSPGNELPRLLYKLQVESPERCREVLDQADPAVALKSSRKAAKLAARLGDAQALHRFYSWISLHTDKDATLLYEWSQDLGAAGDGPGELRLLESALSTLSQDDPLYGQFLTAWSLHRGREALPKLQSHLDRHPEDSAVRAAIARKFEAEEAIKLLMSGLELSPGNPVLLEEMGDAYAREGLTAVASDYYQQALESGGDKGKLEVKLK